MLFLVLFITAFTAVITQDLLGVSYHFDANFPDTFNEKKCGNATRWELVSYGYLDIIPPYETSSNSIRASKNSCTSSFPIVFLDGTLELSVYVRTISKNSGITIAVFDEQGDALVAVRYQRSNKNFMTGWTVISLPITKRTSGYIQLSGQSLSSELVIIDSLRYTPDNFTNNPSDENVQILQKSPISSTTNANRDSIEIKAFHFEFDEIDGSGGSEENEDDEGSGGSSETEPSVTDDPNSQTEEPGANTDYPSSEEEIIDNTDELGFWNAFTITLVAVGGFVVIGSIGVGSYYIGKNRGLSENPPLDLEALEAPSVIRVPRVRSIFSDAPSERFSRFS